jgi:diguanylate cyclase (GGDEF)-like protein
MRIIERRRSRQINTAVWRRYRVSQAHELRHRLRSVPAIAAGLIVVSGVTLAVRYPDTAAATLSVNGLAALILFTFRPLAGRLSPRGVLALSFLMPGATAAAMAGTVAAEPATFATVMTSLALVAMGAPLLLAWDAPTIHRFEATYAAAVGAVTLSTGFGWLSMDQRIDMVTIVAACCFLGALVGNLLQDLRLRAFEKELELRQLNRELHGYATTDPLTRLRNRRQLDGDVAIMWPSIRRGATSTVVMFDLDHFKRLNDERGHAAGDSTLRLVAMELQRQVRGRDSVYRVGGEEFLVLLRDTSLEAGLQVADRIRNAIEDLGLPSSGGTNPTRLTISGGVAVADSAASTWDAVVAAADAGLYAAKDAGRNRVYGPDGPWVQAA